LSGLCQRADLYHKHPKQLPELIENPVPYSLIDIGVNLTSSAFDNDRDRVVAEALNNGVTHLILTGSSVPDSQAAVLLSNEHPQCYATAGIHPHHANELNPDSINLLRGIAQNNKVKAIGETGLDFNRNFSSPSSQLSAFEAQLELACELNLPVFLHQRDAHKAFYNLIKKYRSRLSGGVAHCFTGDKQELHAYLDLDLYIGITGWICDERRGQGLQAIVKDIPLNRLMLETDAPYLLPRTISPKPKTRRNTPSNLVFILSQVASCMDLSEQEIAEVTSENAKRFFHI